MDIGRDRLLAPNALGQVDRLVATALGHGFEELIPIALRAFDLAASVDVVLNAAFKAWESVNWNPLIIIDKFLYHNILGYLKLYSN